MRKRLIWIIPAALLLMIGLYYIPPIHSRLAWRVDDLRAKIKHYFNPPSEVVFQPSGAADLSIETVILTTRAEYLLTLTPRATLTPLATSTPSQGPTAKPTITSTPLPVSVILKGVKYVDQRNRWNYCGPANITMALNFWGWKGNRDDVAKVIKPGENNPNMNFIDQGKIDKNVMPYEMTGFVSDNTDFNALYRVGGDMNLLKGFISAGYPVIVEKGYYERDANGSVSWMGHYQFVTGYDDAVQSFIVQDTYLDGPNFKIKYDEFYEGWRDFDFLFIVVYPPDSEQKVHDLLGNWSDDEWANRHALDIANEEITTQSGFGAFFAWFNKGTSHALLQEYVDAASAYDQAFSIYATLDNVKRPYRMLWYQTGPYKAYYYSARYADVIDLATITLDSVIGGPYLEESLYWRGMAYYMSGQTDLALDDYYAALKVHPNWIPATQALQDLGVFP
ncbi:MAG: C39 family peptidase [Chloroflexi bacterium]|nr:C39 family peptidase [Chloroflexota bacterium]